MAFRYRQQRQPSIGDVLIWLKIRLAAVEALYGINTAAACVASLTQFYRETKSQRKPRTRRERGVGMSEIDDWSQAYARLESARATVLDAQPLCKNTSPYLISDLEQAEQAIERVRWALGRHIRRAREGREIDT